MNADLFYPLRFQLNRKILVWGTEDWTVSAVPGSESEIANGTWAGMKLPELVSRYPAEILGRKVAEAYGNQLPLLTKVIDAERDLSIQVHPNDEMAQREHNKSGKSEMWYILQADEGAHLYAGFKQHITPYEYQKRVEDGSITEVLADHQVKAGDVFYLPAGRVHAICGGIKLAEVQQSSDVTYRIYDYNRPGLDGKPRELHTALAAQAIDYTVYPEYKTQHAADCDVAHKVLNTPYFSIKVVEATSPFHRNMLKYDSFIIMMNLKGDCQLQVHATQETIALPEGASCLIPAAVADYDILPSAPSAKVLEAFINNRKTMSDVISEFLRWNG